MLRQAEGAAGDYGIRDASLRRSGLRLSALLRLSAERQLRDDDVHYESRGLSVELSAEGGRLGVFCLIVNDGKFVCFSQVSAKIRFRRALVLGEFCCTNEIIREILLAISQTLNFRRKFEEFSKIHDFSDIEASGKL